MPEPKCIVFVNANSPEGNGTSWANATPNLQFALEQTADPQYSLNCNAPNPGLPPQIWVAQGTYIPSAIGDREASFQLHAGVKLYGGFFGNETSKDQIVPGTYVSILSGDLQGNDTDNFGNTQENSYNVVTGNALPSGCVLDGFTIRGAMNNSSSTRGGGMYLNNSTMHIRNVVFSESQVESQLTGNGGAGLYILRGAPVLNNTTFQGNRVTTGGAYNGGGGLYVMKSDPTLRDTTFMENEVMDSTAGTTYQGGGAVFLKCIPSNAKPACQPTLINTTFLFNNGGDHGHGFSGGGAIYSVQSSFQVVNADFYENEALGASNGGAVYQWGKPYGSPQIVNATFMANVAGDLGDGIYSYDTQGNLAIINAILMNNKMAGDTPTITHSCAQPVGLTGPSNHTCDFVTLDEGIYPPVNSVAHNGGADSANSEEFDVEGNPRKVGTIDMGAYERQ